MTAVIRHSRSFAQQRPVPAARPSEGSQQVRAEAEQIQPDAVHRQEPLRVRGGCEPPQVSLALAPLHFLML